MAYGFTPPARLRPFPPNPTVLNSGFVRQNTILNSGSLILNSGFIWHSCSVERLPIRLVCIFVRTYKDASSTPTSGSREEIA